MKGQLKKQKRLERQNELLKNFEGDFYQEKKVGNEWYIKSFNGGTKRWQVSVYSEISYNNYKSFQESREPKRQKWNIKPPVPFERPTLESIIKMTNKTMEEKKEIEVKIPNDLTDKYSNLFTTGEQYQAVLVLISQAYKKGFEDGGKAEYNIIMGD